MTKKLAAILALSAAGLLAGGTFAAYVVTDNANPFGIKISPSEIEEEKTGSVTLAWGENTVANVSNLEMNVPTSSGVVVLKGTGTNADNSAIASYDGQFTITLTKLSGEAVGGKTLVDYIKPYVFSGSGVTYDSTTKKFMQNEAEVSALSATHEANSYVWTYNVSGTPAGSTYQVFFEIDNGITADIYSQVLNHKVYAEFDWAKASADSDQGTYYLYDAAGVFGENPYVYAYGTNAQNKVVNNGAWPGVALTKVTDHYYSCTLSASLTTVIFSGNDKQTVDLTANVSKPYFTLGEAVAEGENAGKYNATASETAPEVTGMQYYITGNINGVTSWYDGSTWFAGASSWLMDDEPGSSDAGPNRAQINEVTLKEGDEFKVVDTTGEWYGAEGGGNYMIDADGVYDICVNANGIVYAWLHNNG